MVSPDELEHDVTLRTAVAKYEALRMRESLVGTSDPDEPDAIDEQLLSRGEELELLALAEVITRKVGYGRQLSVRAARQAGASWSEIGRALGTSKQSAWEAHSRWIDQQVEQNKDNGVAGFDAVQASRARQVTGSPELETKV